MLVTNRAFSSLRSGTIRAKHTCRSALTFGSIMYSHSNAMIAGGSSIETRSGRGDVRRRQVSHPSRQYCTPSSTLPAPSHRVMSFANEPNKALETTPPSAVDLQSGVFMGGVSQLGRSSEISLFIITIFIHRQILNQHHETSS
jgi:hypothetical protein